MSEVSRNSLQDDTHPIARHSAKLQPAINDLVRWPQPKVNSGPCLRISVVTPSFNQAEFLEATIQSVLCQDYPNLEYIIIDGGSTDGSVEIIKKYEKFLHHWTSAPDGGMYAGIAKGMAVATGDVLAWLNSDDLYLPWALTTVSSIMSDLPEVEWLSTLQPGSWDERGFFPGCGAIKGFAREAFLDGRYLPGGGRGGVEWIQQESTFWRRRLWGFVDQGRFAKFSMAGDFYLWSEFYKHAELHGVRHSLGGFRHQRQQKTRSGMGVYIDEARKCLADVRKSVGWKSDWRRNVMLDLRLNRIPRIGRSLVQSANYRGMSIARSSSESGDWGWSLRTDSFL